MNNELPWRYYQNIRKQRALKIVKETKVARDYYTIAFQKGRDTPSRNFL
jgi:hypothetical protein